MSTDNRSNVDSESGSAFEKRRKNELKAWRKSQLLIALVFAAVPLLGAVVMLSLHGRAIDQPTAASNRSLADAIVPLRDAVGSLTGIVAKPEVVLSEQEKADISLELDRLAVIRHLMLVETNIRGNQAATKAWHDLLAATLTDEAGRRIGNAPHSLQEFIALQEMANPGLQVGLEATTKLSQLVTQADATPSARELEGVRNSAKELLKELTASTQELNSYVEYLSSMRASSEISLATSTLSQILDEREQQSVDNQRSQVEAAVRRVNSEIDLELQELGKKAEAILAGPSHSTPTIDDSVTQHYVQPTVVPTVAMRDSYAKKHLEIRTLLVPFTSPGYAQPVSADEFEFERAKKPMSYSALVKIGALQDTNEGRQILLKIGGMRTPAKRNDRPLGMFPRVDSIQALSDPKIANVVRDAQQLLRTYAGLLLEENLLSE